ncbi:MAG: DeoR/GlpR family DNA-binding transcription regulator [Oscillospiraceae bacterium]
MERTEKIEGLIREKKKLSLRELVVIFNVSESSIRRDLILLENKGVLRRTHGGAELCKSVMPITHELFQLPIEIQNHEAKQAIGRLAAAEVGDNDFIGIGSGTSCLEFARCLTEKKNLTVLTTNIFVATELSAFENIQVICTGGMITRKNNCANTVGEITLSQLVHYNTRKVFLSVLGADFDMGYSDINFNLSAIWQEMLHNSEHSYLLAEGYKFGKKGYVTIGGLNCVDEVITTSSISSSYVEYFNSHGITVHIAAQE